MGRYLVKASCKAGPGVYLKEGQVVDVDMPEYKGLSQKFTELKEAGLLVPHSGELPTPEVAPVESPLDTPEGEATPPSPSDEEGVTVESQEGDHKADAKKSGKK